jgi:DNA-binding Lrp family transcriptional regulator
MMFDEVDLKILTALQGDIPVVNRPFNNLAESLGISEEEVLKRIETMQQKGIIRRVGAVLRHQQAGYKVNAMVVWKVDPESADEAGRIMSQFEEVSHCYLRKIPPEINFDYSLFAMIHAQSNENLSHIIQMISEHTGLKDMLIVRSIEELKKVSMQYF